MKLVLDTNIFVAAGFNPHSASAAIIDMGEQGNATLVWNDATRAETKAVLRRIPPLNWDDFRGCFESRNRFDGETRPAQFQVIEDPTDRKFAALAAAAGAILISNDDHLLAVRGELEDMTVYTPEEFTAQQS